MRIWTGWVCGPGRGLVKSRLDILITAANRMTTSSQNGQRQKAVAQQKAIAREQDLAEFGESSVAEQQVSEEVALKITFGFLNAEQNAFLREYFRNGRKSLAAFRVAYPNNKSNDMTAQTRAYQMLKSPSIAMAIAQVEKEARRGLVLSLEDHLARLATLSEEAQKCRQYSAAINAEVHRGKASGLYITRTEITGKDGAPIGVSAVPTDEYLRARQQVLQEV